MGLWNGRAAEYWYVKAVVGQEAVANSHLSLASMMDGDFSGLLRGDITIYISPLRHSFCILASTGVILWFVTGPLDSNDPGLLIVGHWTCVSRNLLRVGVVLWRRNLISDEHDVVGLHACWYATCS